MRSFVAVVLLLPTLMFAQDRSHGRSMVVTTYGIVATSHVQASQAGAQILARGGSAIDAAIAANAVLGVTDPEMNGIGGDLFAIVWDAKTKKLYGLNASGRSPYSLTLDEFKKRNLDFIPMYGPLAVSVPGCVDGWFELHKRFGKLPMTDVLANAINYARTGFPVANEFATELALMHITDTKKKGTSEQDAYKANLLDLYA